MLEAPGFRRVAVLLGFSAALLGSACGTSLAPMPVPDPGPRADAGPATLELQTGEARTASVPLDASGSVPGGWPIASYSWIESDRVIASGMTASVELGTGSHDILLLVTDAVGAQDTDRITVLVSSSPRREYELTIAVVGRGQISPGVGTTIHPAGLPVSVRAVPDSGFQFVRWTGDFETEASALTVLMTSDRFLQAEFRLVAGDGSNVPRFFLPLPAGQQRTLSQGPLGAATHQNRYAWDFPMPIGTPIVASGAGRVVDVFEESLRNSPDDAIILNPANIVRIDHGSGLMSDYAHIDWHGSRVEPGQLVARGQVIALSCNTGPSTGPHLHYEVTDVMGRSLPSGFLDVTDDEADEAGDIVLSRNELSIESVHGFEPSSLPLDAFEVNGIELIGPTPPAFFYLNQSDYLIGGRVLDDRSTVCLAIVDLDDCQPGTEGDCTPVFCELTEVAEDGSFLIPFRFPASLSGRFFMGLISGEGGVQGLTQSPILIEPPPDGVRAPQAVIAAPDEPNLDFGDTRELIGSGSTSYRTGHPPVGDDLDYQWVQVSGPTARIEDPRGAETRFTLDFSEGIERVAFQLTVFDGEKHSLPAQVSFFMPDTFHVFRINVADSVCDSADQCPDLDPPLVSFGEGVIVGWIEVLNAHAGDVFHFDIVDPFARPIREAELEITGPVPGTSFWRFVWTTEGMELLPGEWTGVFTRNSQVESTVAFRVMP
jgi:murein DD-endopeptidase MepM/ murein hydrolase activator NlpD